MPERDATLAGLQFDDDAANNRTDVYRAGNRVLRLGADGSIGDVTGNVTGDVTGNLTTGTVTRKVAQVAVTATQLRTLRATPVQLVAGVAGKILVFEGMAVTAAITAAFDSVGAGEDLAVRMVDDSGPVVSAAIDTTTDIDFGNTTAGWSGWVPPLAAVVAPSNMELEPLLLHNVGGGELAAADDDANGNATLTCTVVYLEIAV